MSPDDDPCPAWEWHGCLCQEMCPPDPPGETGESVELELSGVWREGAFYDAEPQPDAAGQRAGLTITSATHKALGRPDRIRVAIAAIWDGGAT